MKMIMYNDYIFRTVIRFYQELYQETVLRFLSVKHSFFGTVRFRRLRRAQGSYPRNKFLPPDGLEIIIMDCMYYCLSQEIFL